MSWGELAGIARVVPLDVPVPAPPGGPVRSMFSAPLSATAELLEREIGVLSPTDVLLEAAFLPGQLRMDGLPRSTARASSPGVRLTLLSTKHGHDLRYPCATYASWEDNLRAIALALEALRKVDRYGVTQRGEQYRGFAQLTAGAAVDDVARGRELIAEHGGPRSAQRATHPDHGGDADDFRAVQAAIDAGGAA